MTTVIHPIPTPNPGIERGIGASAPVLAAPSGLRRFDAKPGEWPARSASYAQHPAYATSGVSLPTRVAALATFARYFALILCKRLISYELIPTHVRARGGAAFIGSALRNIGRRLARGRAPAAGRGAPVAQALHTDGVCVAPIETGAFAAVEAAAQPLLGRLRERRGRRVNGGRDFIESRGVALRTCDAELFNAVEAMLEGGGLLDGISAYLGRRARLVDVNPQINDATDDFWRHIFTDLPPSDRPARYFHKDASGGDIKAILYVSDVGPTSGPFCYAIGSHAARLPRLVSWIEETNDQSGFSGTGLEARRSFSALPAALQRKCAAGNDLLPGDEAARHLLRAEWVITAPRGYIAIFDTKGFHRGGMVAEGERVVLTCVIG